MDKIKLDSTLLAAAAMQRQTVEEWCGIRASVDICLWYPPETEIEFVGDWQKVEHRFTNGRMPFDCYMLYGDGASVVVYISETKKDGLLTAREETQ